MINGPNFVNKCCKRLQFTRTRYTIVNYRAYNIMLTHGRIYIKRALHFSPGRDDEGELKMMGVRRIRKESITRNTWIGA